MHIFRRCIPLLSFAVSATVLCVSLVSGVHAQKLPLALKDTTELSPSNVTTYKATADRYAASPNIADRNQLIYMAIAQVDLNFGDFHKKTRKGNQRFQILADILEIAMATAISITNGERAKTVIADSLGFVQGSHKSINKNLHLLEMEILFNKMIAKRSEILKAIADKAALSDDQYPFSAALVDITAYYEAGTLDGALSALAADTGREASNASREIPTILLASKEQLEKDISFDNYVTDLQKKALKGDADAIKKIKGALKSYAKSGMDSNGVLPTKQAEIDKLDELEPAKAVELLKNLRHQFPFMATGRENAAKLLDLLKQN